MYGRFDISFYCINSIILQHSNNKRDSDSLCLVSNFTEVVLVYYRAK